ncbi:MAG: CBS domain-containing protein [Acidimicrobiia bacterium]
MIVNQLMTRDPACCTPETTLQDVARMMVEHDCGEIPIVRGRHDKRLVGVVTDRDIVCRTVARGTNPLTVTAQDCMSTPVVTVTPDTTLEDCVEVMEEHQIRRVPVVDATGMCCGIVAQSDIAKRAPEEDTADLVKEVSR